MFDHNKQISMLMPRTWFKVEEFTLKYLCPVSIYISFLRNHISFFSSCWRAGVSFLEVKYDIFRNGEEGTCQKHLEWYSQHNIVDSYPHVSDILQSDEAFMVEETYTHTDYASLYTTVVHCYLSNFVNYIGRHSKHIFDVSQA